MPFRENLKWFKDNWDKFGFIYIPLALFIVTILLVGGGITMIVFGKNRDIELLFITGIVLVIPGSLLGLCFVVFMGYLVANCTNPNSGLSH